MAAVAALGTLGDPKALAILEKFVGESKESPLRIAAEKSMTSLRDSKKPSAELGSLRTELLSLQRENRDLRKDVDDLKKKLDSLSSTKPIDVKSSKRPSHPKATKPD